MAVPKKRTSRSKKRMRRSHEHLPVLSYSTCTNCGEMKKQHFMCFSCKFYKGQKIL